jgi:CBS domain-containing protein
MNQVSDILARKGNEVLTIDRNETVYAAIEKMVAKNVGSIVVTESDGAICGIFTERDYLRRIALEGKTSKGTTVGDVMSIHLIATSPEQTVEECMAIMAEHKIRHLPVMQGPKLVGIVSIGDLAKHLSAERKVRIRYLEDYITGKYPG